MKQICLKKIFAVCLLVLAFFIPCRLEGQPNDGEAQEVPAFTEVEQTFKTLSVQGGMTAETIEIVVVRWGEVQQGTPGQQQKFTISVVDQPFFMANLKLLGGPELIFGPDENQKAILLQFDTVAADQLPEEKREEELVIVIKADDPGIIPEERRLIIPFTIGARPDRPRVSAYPLKPDAPDSFPIEEAAQYCVLDVSEINEYDKIVVFFTPKRDLNKSNPEEFRFRIKNPNGKIVSRREFVKSQPGDEERGIDLKFTRPGSPGRFAVKLNLWDVQWLPKDPAKRWHMPGKYMLETIRLKPAAGTGLWGQGQGYKKEDGEWQEEGSFEVKDGRIHFAGFVTEPLKNRSLPRTKWRWDGETNIEKIKVDIEKGDVYLNVSSWWRNTKRRDDGTFGTGDKISRGQTDLTMVFPQSIRPGKVVQKLDRLGSFRYPLEPVAEVDIEWTVEGDDNAIYTPVFLRPVPFRGPPSRQAPSEGWGGRSVIDQSLDVPKAILNKAWMPARDRKCVYRVGVCDHYKPFGVPSRTLAWHIHDSDTLWLFPVKFTLASDVEFYGYGIYRSLTGPYDGPQPEEPPWGKTGSASDDEAGPGGVQIPDEEGEDVPDTDEETGSVAETDTDVLGEDAPGLPGTGEGVRGKPIDPKTLDPNSEDVARLIREWISVAEPPENAVEGANWRYDKFGRMVGSGPGMRTVRTHDTVDYGGGTPEASAWSLRKNLDSINHCTLEEYVVAKLEQKSISHCVGRYGAVKDLKGMRLAKAKAAITNAGFKYSLAPGTPAKTLAQEGTIERQEPGPEQYLKKGQTVVLSVHAPYVPAVLVIPDFRGKPLADARNWLRENELKADLKAGCPAPTSDKSGMVASQDPAPGTKLKQGKGVKLEVYGPYNPKVAVPDVAGLEVKKAKAKLKVKRLKARLVASGPAPSSGLSLKVKESEPKAGAKVAPGTEVTVKVYGKYSQPFVAVPKVAGLSFSNAKAQLARAGLKVSAKSAGPAPSKAKSSRIKSQEPVAGEKVNPGSEVKVYVFSKYIPADPNERIEEREQVQAWVLVDTLVNPQNKPTEFIVGVTPNYYSPRYQGSFDKYKVEETYITYKKYHVDRGVLKANIEMRADFTKPPKTLVPGEIISLKAKISASGTSPGIGTDVWFKYRAKGINLKGDTLTNTGTNSKPPYRTNSISSYFIVPKIHKGTIEIYASLNCGACDVRWIYRAQKVDQGVEAPEVPRKPTPEEQVANADCSNYPGSRAYWDKAAGKPKCGCFGGLKWNLSKTRCVSSETHADEICARDYPGSVANGRTSDGKIICDCPQGYVWNSNRTKCVRQLSPQKICARDYPGSVPGGRDASGNIICNCPQGYVWTADKSRCVKKPSGGGRGRKRKNTCYDMAGRWESEGNVVEFATRDGVNYEGRLITVSSHWRGYGLRPAQLIYRVKKIKYNKYKGQALFGDPIGLTINAPRCNHREFYLEGVYEYQNWKRKR